MKLDEGFEWSANLFQRRFWTPIFPILFQHSSGNSLQPRKTSVDIVSKRDEIRTWYISCVYSVATVSVRRYRTLRVYVVVCWCLLLFMCTNKRVFVFVCVCVCVCARARDAKLRFQNSCLWDTERQRKCLRWAYIYYRYYL